MKPLNLRFLGINLIVYKNRFNRLIRWYNMVSNSRVGELFANGNIKGKSGNMFIDGNSVYSYGFHFTIATRIKNGVYLFNNNGYSSSTAKHKSIIKCAISGVIIELGECNLNNTDKQITHNLDKISDLTNKLTRARSKNSINSHKTRIAYLTQQNVLLEKLKSGGFNE